MLFSPLLLFQSPVRPCTSDDAIVLPCLRCIPLHCRRRNDVDNDDYDDARAYRGVSEPIRRSYEVTGQAVIARRQVCRALVSYSRSPHSRNYFVTLSCILRRRRNTSLRECERDRRGGRERERETREERKREAPWPLAKDRPVRGILLSPSCKSQHESRGGVPTDAPSTDSTR